jgi:hypothetical protein
MPKTGTRKLIQHIENDLIKNNIKMGRDALFDLLRSYGMLVKKTKRFHITTDSKHFFFKSPNLLKDLTLNHAEQVFVSDITYIKVDDGHAYLALVTDAYSKCLSPLNDWTKIVNQFSHSKFRNHVKTKKTIQSGGEVQYSSGG